MQWKQDKKGARLPVYSWCQYLEEGAAKQVIDLSVHPRAFHHIAIMPDCHTGQGMPIGGVMACEGAVIPNCVGVDIGCGMIAAKTTCKAHGMKDKKIIRILDRIKKEIPVGYDHRANPVRWGGFDRAPDIPIIKKELASASHQLGTLGGGNHFIELQADEAGLVWIMIHSGSRNFGYKIARTYNEKAIEMCNGLGVNKGLAFLWANSKEGEEYIASMNYALEFAYQNRMVMLEIALGILCDVMNCEEEDRINIHHNYASPEKHFGKMVWVHRKGATSAREGEMGIIPGSMGTSSYIVRGLGNPDSFQSCSHGAGRVLSRSLACRKLDKAQCEKDMKGIIFDGWKVNKRGHADLAEAPRAYKDIGGVMDAQKDLVEIVTKLHPLGVIKG